MTIIREKDSYEPEIIKNSIDYCEMFDYTNFFTPAEIRIFDDEKYW